ncbi:hypothetical protein HZS55_22260 [Halosimplex rubrum]|uniref:Restriction endonuclease n=1 Tax=Halosimplex rubrum TaxID=869889 RepID=A0A7D5T8H2_9EURY|nr:hypothetical protein [Halosimplex rubrum]QLH79853.1 hypothetical protein HZS55_22260 [Halosimplex rubrum]
MGRERSEREREVISEFLSDYFPERCGNGTQGKLREADGESSDEISDSELGEIESMVDRVEDAFSTSKGTLGLAIDFLMVAEQLSRVDDRLSGFDGSIDRVQILDWYENTAKTTLTPKYDGERFSIRSVHNDVIDLFREDLERTNFPSSPGHHTGEWERYDDLLESSFRLSSAGRFEAAQRIFDLGLEELAARAFDTREPPFPDPLREILNDYERSHPEEEGGLTYQALCYGYVKAKWSHLSFRASKVRTGSSRQHRHGDIDGYYGPDLMLSVEVKDRDILTTNVDSELGTMIELAERTNVVVVAVCKHVDEGAANILDTAGVRVVTDEDIDAELPLWDYHKQNRAIQGMVHFLASIEEDPAAVQRLLRFIQTVDPENPALAHLSGDE